MSEEYKTPTITAFLADEGDGGHVGLTFSRGTGICRRLKTFFFRTPESGYKEYYEPSDFHEMREDVLYVEALQQRVGYAESTLEYKDKQLREVSEECQKYRNLYANAQAERDQLQSIIDGIVSEVAVISKETMDDYCCRPLVTTIAEKIQEQVQLNPFVPLACKPDLSEGL